MSDYRLERRRLFEPAERLLILDVPQAVDWPHVAALLAGLEQDLAMPLPALSVEGRSTAYRLWFSLAPGVTIGLGRRLLEALQAVYLADLPQGHCQITVPGDEPVAFPPRSNGQGWSAFVDPQLGGMFRDDPWLEMELDQRSQAERLAQIVSLTEADVQRALETLAPRMSAGVAVGHGGASLALISSGAQVQSAPAAFLLSVMNDERVELALRIEAAKALLPFGAALLGPDGKV